MIRTSDSVAAISAAWVAAAAELPNVPKETKGQVGNAIRYYADMATVVETVRPILAKHGLAYVQGCSDGEKFVTVTTRLIHQSGEWLEDCLSMPIGQGTAQAVGSAISYARRYSLMGLLGLAPDDDDGAAASKPAPRRAATPPQPPTTADPADPALQALLDEEARIAARPAKPSGVDKQIQRIQILLNGYGDRTAKLSYLSGLVGRDLASSNDLTEIEKRQVIHQLETEPPR